MNQQSSSPQINNDYVTNLIESQPDSFQPREKKEADELFCLLNCQKIEDCGFITWSRENYNRFSFEYVYEGEGVLEINGLSYHLKPGDVFILPFGFDHSYHSLEHSRWKKIFFNCTGTLPDSLLKLYSLSGQYHFPRCNKAIELLFVQILKQFQQTSDFWERSRKGAGSLLEIICELSRLHLTSNDRIPIPTLVQHVVYAIRHQIKQKGVLDVEKLAMNFNMTPVHLRRIFKKYMHCSPYDFFLQTKIDLATDMLKNPQCSITDIARELNYANTFYFSKLFKQKKGVAPSKYRKPFLER